MRGGRVLLFVDPEFRRRHRAARTPPIPMAGAMANHSSDLEPLLAGWGVDYDPTKVIGDLDARAGSSHQRMQAPPVRHIGILGLAPRRHESEGCGHRIAGVHQSRDRRLAAQRGRRKDHVRAVAAEFDERSADSRAALQRPDRSLVAARWIQADGRPLRPCRAHHRARWIRPFRKARRRIRSPPPAARSRT